MQYVEKTISAGDGLRLYVRDYPKGSKNGQTIFCLCGLTRNSKDFDDLAILLNDKGHRVITLDYRGRGLSERDSEWANYNPKTYIGDIFNVAAALNLHGCVFIGTSLGGLLTSALCTVAPTLVSKVVLNDVGPELNATGIAKIIEYTGDDTAVHTMEEAVQKLKSHYDKEHAALGDDVFLNIAEKTYRLQDGMYRPDWDTKIADAIKLAAQSDEKDDLWALFKSIGDRPSLVIRGVESDVLNQGTYEKMLETLSNIKGIELPNVGHAPTLNEPKAVEAILELIG